MQCPRCKNGSIIYKAKIAALTTEVYVCQGCEALWTHAGSIGPLTYVPLALFLDTHGLTNSPVTLTDRDDNWDGSQTIDMTRTAVEADPANLALRLQFATMLLDAGRASECLDQCTTVLAQDPTNLQALYMAAQAAAALGDTKREESYRRLVRALSGVGEGMGRQQQMSPPPRSPEDVSSDVVSVDKPPSAASQERVATGDGQDHDDEQWRVERSWVTLADVAGMEAVKRRLHVAFLAPLRNPELRKMYGKSLRGGMLLYGPPGCGKTFLARAVAGELGASFIPVGLSDVLDMWLGQSERRLHDIFTVARRQAPAVIFFDEMDALGQKRSQLRNHGGRNVVNQLLSELDGIAHDNEGVFVLGATNQPWDVDAALLRPGRFDRMLLVLPPDEAARLAIVRAQLVDRPAENVDTAWVAAHTKDFSGADVAHLCESAAELAMEESALRGAVRPITTADFKRVLKDVRPTTRPWFETARNYAMFANESGVYDELVAYMRANKLL